MLVLSKEIRYGAHVVSLVAFRGNISGRVKKAFCYAWVGRRRVFVGLLKLFINAFVFISSHLYHL